MAAGTAGVLIVLTVTVLEVAVVVLTQAALEVITTEIASPLPSVLLV